MAEIALARVAWRHGAVVRYLWLDTPFAAMQNSPERAIGVARLSIRRADFARRG